MPSGNAPIVTGYYRWTDIKHAWKEVLLLQDSGEGNPLAAVLAYDGLVHPDHPLHIEGIEGVQLYQGVFANGESRLLFSSKQVDYLRYWLHAMQLTKEPLPLPYSNAMLTESNLRNVAPVVYKTADDLKQGFKAMEKINRKLKRADPLLHSRRTQFNAVRSLWAKKEGCWLAIDFEAWEYDHTVITEFGFSMIYFLGGETMRESGHFLVKEHRQYKNGTYVPDNSDFFDFGDSETIPRKRMPDEISALFTKAREKGGPLYLVFHDASQDVKYLLSETIQAPMTGYSYILPDSPSSEGIFILDTTQLFSALEGEGGENKRSLQTMCRLLSIDTFHLHNAGNDAHFTMLAFEAMIGGKDIDTQRSERWPSRENEKLKVKFEPFDEDAEYDDLEGVLGTAPDPHFGADHADQ